MCLNGSKFVEAFFVVSPHFLIIVLKRLIFYCMLCLLLFSLRSFSLGTYTLDGDT